MSQRAVTPLALNQRSFFSGAAELVWNLPCSRAGPGSLFGCSQKLPGAARAVAMRKLAALSCPRAREEVSARGIVPALITATPGSWKRLCRAQKWLGDSGDSLVILVPPVRNSWESQCIAQSLFYPQEMSLWFPFASVLSGKNLAVLSQELLLIKTSVPRSRLTLWGTVAFLRKFY